MGERNSKRGRSARLYLAGVIAVLAVLSAVSAAVYTFRSMDTTIVVHDKSEATGIAAAGFYTGGNAHLPYLDSLNGSSTYGGHKVEIHFTNPVAVDSDGSTNVTLYSKATITTDVVVG